MNKSKTPPFYVGEEVEYIGDNPKLKYGTKVIVERVEQEICGCWLIDHSHDAEKMRLEKIPPYHLSWICCICEKDIGIITFCKGWRANSFRRLQRPKPMTFVKLAEIIEQEKEEVLTLN